MPQVLPTVVTPVALLNCTSLGTASFIPSFFFDRSLGDSQSFTFEPFTDLNCTNEYTYEAFLVDDNTGDDLSLPWSNLLLTNATLKITLDKWDELGLGPTQIRVVGTVAGLEGTISAKFTIQTVGDCPSGEFK